MEEEPPKPKEAPDSYSNDSNDVARHSTIHNDSMFLWARFRDRAAQVQQRPKPPAGTCSQSLSIAVSSHFLFCSGEIDFFTESTSLMACS